MRSLRDRLLLGERKQRQLARAMELSLIGLLGVGVYRGSVGIIVNTGVALLVTQLPPLLERDYNLTMSPLLTLWLTAAAFLHALGVVGIPGTGLSFYTTLGWWDHLTHSLSASVVAATGYATVRAFDLHSDHVHIPPRFVTLIILIFVLAFGVLWELLEFAIGIAAEALGTSGVLTQYGIDDTLLDLTFNSIGGLLVALWGGIYLSDFVTSLRERLDSRTEEDSPH